MVIEFLVVYVLFKVVYDKLSFIKHKKGDKFEAYKRFRARICNRKI